MTGPEGGSIGTTCSWQEAGGGGEEAAMAGGEEERVRERVEARAWRKRERSHFGGRGGSVREEGMGGGEAAGGSERRRMGGEREEPQEMHTAMAISELLCGGGTPPSVIMA